MQFTDAISIEELAALRERSSWTAARMVAVDWATIAVIFAVVAAFPNPLTIVLALILLGGRQLGLAVMMHECGHNILFEGGRANQWVGRWLCAYPILSDMKRYSKGHLGHHRYAGTPKDPDLGNYARYPVSRESFRRKVIRDLTGQTGIKLLRGVWLASRQRLMRSPAAGNSLAGQLITNGALLAVLWAFGHPELYLLWIGAFVTTFPLYSRLRQVAEHGAVPDRLDLDPRQNTRTTLVRWWERLLVAPNNVNYHLEHHLSSAVPCYRLPEMHAHLVRRGFYKGVEFPVGYGQLFAGLLRG